MGPTDCVYDFVLFNCPLFNCPLFNCPRTPVEPHLLLAWREFVPAERAALRRRATAVASSLCGRSPGSALQQSHGFEPEAWLAGSDDADIIAQLGLAAQERAITKALKRQANLQRRMAEARRREEVCEEGGSTGGLWSWLREGVMALARGLGSGSDW